MADEVYHGRKDPPHMLGTHDGMLAAFAFHVVHFLSAATILLSSAIHNLTDALPPGRSFCLQKLLGVHACTLSNLFH